MDSLLLTEIYPKWEKVYKWCLPPYFERCIANRNSPKVGKVTKNLFYSFQVLSNILLSINNEGEPRVSRPKTFTDVRDTQGILLEELLVRKLCARCNLSNSDQKQKKKRIS